MCIVDSISVSCDFYGVINADYMHNSARNADAIMSAQLLKFQLLGEAGVLGNWLHVTVTSRSATQQF